MGRVGVARHGEEPEVAVEHGAVREEAAQRGEGLVADETLHVVEELRGGSFHGHPWSPPWTVASCPTAPCALPGCALSGATVS